MGTDLTLQTCLRVGVAAVFLVVPAFALAGEPGASPAEPQVAAARPAAVSTQPRNLPPAALLAYAFLASSGAPLPQTSGNSGR